MGAPRVTTAEIVEMQQLYCELGAYAAVARKMKRSPETVAGYVKMRGVPRNIRVTVENLLQQTK